MLHRRSVLAAAGAALAAPRLGQAADATGITATEIRIGNTAPYSGPASAYGTIARCEAAYFKMVNEQGGIAGRKINFISYDDGYSPPKTVEQVRRLVEQDQVACLFSNLGTPTNSAVLRYTNQRKVPNLFPSTGADKWSNYQEFPWTMGFPPSYRIEAQLYAKHILAAHPAGRIAILHQNDDFGRDYVHGVRDVLGAKFEEATKVLSYESTDPTIDQQLITLQASGCQGLVLAVTAKFASMAIRKMHEIGWKPTTCVHYGANSVGVVIQPAGMEKAVGLTTAAYLKDPTDPAWAQNAGMLAWRGFMAKYMPDADARDSNYVNGFNYASAMVQVLRQAGNDLSRENIMRQATNLKNVELPMLLPGIRVNTSPANYYPVQQMQLMRWSGKQWERFGDLLQAPPDR